MSSDEDILVKQEDYEKIKEILCNEGLEFIEKEGNECAYFCKKTGLCIEVSTSLFPVESKAYGHLNKVFENITLLLKKLNYKGKRLAVFTGKGRKSIQISMKKLELEKYFNYIVSDDDVANSKPDSEGILKILDHYNATPSDAIFFGDSDADIISAKKANVLAVGVNWYKTRKFTISPDIISKNPLDIIYSC